MIYGTTKLPFLEKSSKATLLLVCPLLIFSFFETDENDQGIKNVQNFRISD